MALALKKQILKEVRSFGLAGEVNDEALDCITAFLQEKQSSDLLQQLLQQCIQDRPTSGLISKGVVEAAIAQLEGKGQGVDLITVISAFDVPKISYDAVARKLFTDSAPRTLFAPASVKQRLYLDRLQLLMQRVRRHKYFQQGYKVLAHAPGANTHQQAQLTDLQSLRGMVGETRFVMGCISQGEDGHRLVLEDASGSVPLDISTATCSDGFVTENCIVIAKGHLAHDGVFHAAFLGLPPAELREDLPEVSKRLNFFGGAPLGTDDLAALAAVEASGAHREDRMVVCSNVWLDQAVTLDRLKVLFKGFQDVAIVPSMFIFMGNFHSKATSSGTTCTLQRTGSSVDFVSLKEGFAALARLIDQFPRIKPLRRPAPAPLPAFFTEELLQVVPQAVFTTNPCRIRYLSRQIVVFRYDILKRLRRRCLLPLAGGEPTTADDMWKHLTLTLLQQSHLCPLPLLHQPMHWQFDHALQLYPLPHAVIVADASPQTLCTQFGCDVFTPGSFADGQFAAYLPCQQVVELSEVPTDGLPSQWDQDELLEQELQEEEEEEGGQEEDLEDRDGLGVEEGLEGEEAGVGVEDEEAEGYAGGEVEAEEQEQQEQDEEAGSDVPGGQSDDALVQQEVEHQGEEAHHDDVQGLDQDSPAQMVADEDEAAREVKRARGFGYESDVSDDDDDDVRGCRDVDMDVQGFQEAVMDPYDVEGTGFDSSLAVPLGAVQEEWDEEGGDDAMVVEGAAVEEEKAGE